MNIILFLSPKVKATCVPQEACFHHLDMQIQCQVCACQDNCPQAVTILYSLTNCNIAPCTVHFQSKNHFFKFKKYIWCQFCSVNTRPPLAHLKKIDHTHKKSRTPRHLQAV